MKEVSVVIPAYNEEGAIADVIKQVHGVLRDISTYEIIVVNDGSADHTREQAQMAGATVISNPVNMGYGFSLKRGIREAKYECVVITDADGTYPIDQIPALIAEFEKGFDMVVGARQGSFYWSSNVKNIARMCFKWMSEYVVGKKIPDINSGFRAIRRSLILPILPDLSNTFSFSTSSTLIFMLKKYFVGYVPVQYHKRTGKSKVKYLRDALVATQIMVEIIARYNPIKLFLLLAAGPSFLAVLFVAIALVRLEPGFFFLALYTTFFSIVLISMGFLGAILKSE